MTGEELRIETGVPGAVVSIEELADGVLVERNGAGSVVAHVYPYGLDEPEEALEES